jgi:hypothetical protein
MKFFLDFDGVLLNIEGLKEKMAALGFKESERTAELFTRMKAVDPFFSVEAFLFRDALTFLTAHKEDCYVVSSYISSKAENNTDDEDARGYQEEKIRASSVTDILGEEKIHVVGHSKSDALKDLSLTCAGEGEECIFIDDRIPFVEEAKALGITAFHMNRTGAESAAAEAIDSFDDLEEKLRTWNK